MRLLKAALAVFVLAVFAVPQSVFAQDTRPTKPNCFEQAAVRLRPNQTIKLFLRDKSKIKGKFMGLDSVQSLLTMISIKGEDTSRFSYSMSEISKIHYKIGKGKAVLSSLIWGTISGVIVGGLVTVASPDLDSEDFAIMVGASAASNAMGGLIFNQYLVIKCK